MIIFANSYIEIREGLLIFIIIEILFSGILYTLRNIKTIRK